MTPRLPDKAATKAAEALQKVADKLAPSSPNPDPPPVVAPAPAPTPVDPEPEPIIDASEPLDVPGTDAAAPGASGDEPAPDLSPHPDQEAPMPRPTHDESGTPLPAVEPVLREPHERLTYTHDKGGSPIRPFERRQDVEQAVEWTVDGETTRDLGVVAGADPDETEIAESAVTHDAKGTPKAAFSEGAVDDYEGEDDAVVELASKHRSIRGHRDRIDSQANAEARVRSDAAYRAMAGKEG